MPDLLQLALAGGAGASASVLTLGLLGRQRRRSAREWLDLRSAPATRSGPTSVFERAAEHLAALRRRVGAGRRRERLLGQLVPLLELVSLELSGGAPPMLALEGVLARSRSELAAELRLQLIGSRVAGSAAFDARVAALGERLGLPALQSLAMILGLSRDYGSGVGQGVRALAADLRRARRRRLIEISRGALNRVLIPAAVGILLPFLAILLFPAVSVLLRSFAS